MATLWFLFAVLCVATAAPADGGVEQGVAVVASEAVPVLAAVIPKAEEDDEALRQMEERLRQEEGVLKEEVMAAASSEGAKEEVGEPLVEHTKELQDPQSGNPEAHAVFCPDGWFSRGGRCFTIINSAMDWNKAEDHCQTKGANLVSIHNPDENRFLKQLIQLGGQGDVWMGAFYVQSRWRWTDGTGMYFTDWTNPASSTSTPCTCLNSSGWAKVSCSTNMRFICATKPGSC